jgi:2-polyprenyl-3-methyl-5-hydroxy-6-metoxy-1,4-benzoquinol methylase
MEVTLELIKEHLIKCSDSFKPNLNTYVDIPEYSKKIFEKSKMFYEFDGDKLIGLVAVYDNSSGKYGWITNVSVDPDYTKNGIAYKLLNNTLEFFKKKNYNNVYLEVFSENLKAINLYNKHGFNQDKINDNKMTLKKELNKRDYNDELKDTSTHKYVYNFDFDIIHNYMIDSFKHHFVEGNCLELGSFKGDFTKKLIPYFEDITCVEVSNEAIDIAKKELNTLKYYNSLFEDVVLPTKYDNIILTHVLEHIDEPVELLRKIKNEWLSEKGKLFIVCPNANAPSRQIAVKMGLISHNSAITDSEKEHGHRITYTLDTLERDVKLGDLNVIHRSGIFFKALANFQWDRLLNTDIISKEYLDGCFELGQQYPDLCSSIMLICKK